jgi:hypothetical protein
MQQMTEADNYRTGKLHSIYLICADPLESAPGKPPVSFQKSRTAPRKI